MTLSLPRQKADVNASRKLVLNTSTCHNPTLGRPSARPELSPWTFTKDLLGLTPGYSSSIRTLRSGPNTCVVAPETGRRRYLSSLEEAKRRSKMGDPFFWRAASSPTLRRENARLGPKAAARPVKDGGPRPQLTVARQFPFDSEDWLDPKTG